MRAEDLPLSRAEALQNGLALGCAELGGGIYRGHQDGRVLVVLRLLGCHAAHIDVDIPRKGDMVRVIDQHRLTGQMAAAALVDLEVKLSEIEKSYLRQRLAALLASPPSHGHLIGRDRAVAGHGLTHINIGTMQGILLTVAVRPLKFQPQTLSGSLPRDDLIEQREQSAMVHIRVCHQDPLVHPVKLRDPLTENGLHLLTVESVTAIHEKHFPAADDDGSIASARRLNQENLRFSAEAEEEFKNICQILKELANSSVGLLSANDEAAISIAQQVQKRIFTILDDSEAEHLARINNGECRPQVGILYLELLEEIRKVARHLENINDRAGMLYTKLPNAPR